MWRAHIDTGSYEFEAYGLTKTLALGLLRRTLEDHAKAGNYQRQWAEEWGNEAHAYKVAPGSAFRDRQRIKD